MRSIVCSSLRLSRVLKMSELLNKTAPVYEVKKPEVVEEKVWVLCLPSVGSSSCWIPWTTTTKTTTAPSSISRSTCSTLISLISLPSWSMVPKAQRQRLRATTRWPTRTRPKSLTSTLRKIWSRSRKRIITRLRRVCPSAPLLSVDEDENEEPIEKLSDKVARILQNPKTGALFKTLSNAITKEDVDNVWAVSVCDE